MSVDRLVEVIARQIDRRNALVRLGTGAVGSLAALIGLPLGASATVRWRCCDLCKGNSGSCSGCACTWGWSCNQDGHHYQCAECHRDTSYCGPGCSNVKCSYGYRKGRSAVVGTDEGNAEATMQEQSSEEATKQRTKRKRRHRR